MDGRQNWTCIGTEYLREHQRVGSVTHPPRLAAGPRAYFSRDDYSVPADGYATPCHFTNAITGIEVLK